MTTPAAPAVTLQPGTSSYRNLGGYNASVLNLHGVRSVSANLPHLLPFLKPGQSILDVGCGPGSITVSIAEIVGPSGRVVGIDPGKEAVEKARTLAKQNCVERFTSFDVGDAVAGLPFPDGSFDVVLAHQVLLHVPEPVTMLREMRRLAKRPGGVVCLKEADVDSCILYPEKDILTDWYRRIQRTVKAASSEANPNAGRCLKAWCRQAGFAPSEIVHLQASHETFGYDRDDEIAREQRRFWGESTLQRFGKYDEGVPAEALKMGLCNREHLDNVQQAWEEWMQDEDGAMLITHGEVICELA